MSSWGSSISSFTTRGSVMFQMNTKSCTVWDTRGTKWKSKSSTNRLRVLTAFNHHRADLNVMRIRFKFHRAGEHECQPGNASSVSSHSRRQSNSLWHVKQCLVVVQPQVMIWHCHLVEGDFLRILEKAIWSPDRMEPLDVEDSIFLAHVFRQSESRVSPTLCVQPGRVQAEKRGGKGK